MILKLEGEGNKNKSAKYISSGWQLSEPHKRTNRWELLSCRENQLRKNWSAFRYLVNVLNGSVGN